MARGDFPTTVNGRVVGHIIGEGSPCNVNQNMLGMSTEETKVICGGNELGIPDDANAPIVVRRTAGGVPIDNDSVIAVSISGEDYRNTVFSELIASPAEERPDTMINPDIDVAIDCIKQIAIYNGKCPKKVSDGETDDLLCPCVDFLQRGKCSFGLFIEK